MSAHTDTCKVRVWPIAQSFKHRDFEIDAGVALSELTGESNAIVFVNGEFVDQADWAATTLRSGDEVAIRQIQSGGVIAVGLAALAAAAPTIAGAVGITSVLGVAAFSVGVSMLTGLAARSLVSTPDQNVPDYSDPKRVASIVGASNRLDSFGTIDAVYGKVKVVPKLGGKTFTEITADDQYLRMLLVVGHGQLAFTENDISIGNTPITNFDDYELEIRNGHPADAPITLYKNTIDEERLSVVMNQINDSSTRTTAPDTEEITIDLTAPRGLARLQSDGSGTSSVRIGFILETSPVGQNNWTEVNVFGTVGNIVEGDIDYNGGTIPCTFYMWGDTRNTVRAGLSVHVPKGQYDVRLTRRAMVERQNPADPDDPGIFAGVTWTAIRSVIADAGPVIQSDKPLALIALKIRATDQLNGVIDNLSVVVRSVVDVPGVGLLPSSNPAWLYRDVLVGNNAKTPISTGRLDEQAFADWAAECDARGYEFNAKVRPGARFDVLNAIAAMGRASFHMNGDLYSIVRDTVQQAPKQLFTPRNSWDASASRVFQTLPHALRTQYIDPSSDWEQNEIIVYRAGYNANTATEFETFDVTYGITDEQQAATLAQEKFAEAKLRPEVFQRTVDIEHLVCDRGDRVAFQDDALLIGLGSARAFGLDGTSLYLDQTLEMEAGKQYAVQIRTNGNEQELINVVTEPGETEVLTLATTPTINVQPGDLVAFGISGKVTFDAVVRSIEPSDDRSATLTLLPYAPEIYEPGAPPEYDAVITQPTDETRIAPAVPDITSIRFDRGVSTANSDDSVAINLVVEYQMPSSDLPDAKLVNVAYRLSDGPGQNVGTWRIRSYTVYEPVIIPDIQEGKEYDVRIRSESKYGVASNWSPITQDLIAGVLPLRPVTVDVKEGPLSVKLTPDDGEKNLSTLWEFWRHTSNLDNSQIVNQATSLGQTKILTDTGLTGGQSYWYFVRGVNRYGKSQFFHVGPITVFSESANNYYAQDVTTHTLDSISDPLQTLATVTAQSVKSSDFVRLDCVMIGRVAVVTSGTPTPGDKGHLGMAIWRNYNTPQEVQIFDSIIDEAYEEEPASSYGVHSVSVQDPNPPTGNSQYTIIAYVQDPSVSRCTATLTFSSIMVQAFPS